MSRRSFLRVAGAAALSLLDGLDVQAAPVRRTQEGTRKPLITLFLSGGVSAKESFNPDALSVAEDYRGPMSTVRTSVTGVHFNEVFAGLAQRADKFALIRSLDTGSADHTPSQQTAMLTGGRTVSERIGERASDGGVPYLLLNPGSTWNGLTGAFRQSHAYVPLWDSRSNWFRRPEVGGGGDLRERRALLNAFDTTPIHSPSADRMDRFRETAFDLLQGGGTFFQALEEPSKGELKPYGETLAGRMALASRKFVEAGAGSVTMYYEPEAITFDLHNQIAAGMRRHGLPIDQAASALIDDIVEERLSCVLLIMGEFNRTPRINSSAGRDHWQYGNCAIIAGGRTRPGVVHGRVNHRGEIVEGAVTQRDTLPNTLLIAAGEEISATASRVREVLR